jgi:ABC-2 type transport system ATP-binding protein
MEPAINLEKVKKTLGDREILKGISFSVVRGDIFGYLGPNGAGKTTTIRILLGLLKASSGRLDILGQDINLSSTRQKIGFVLDPDGLYDNMTGEENLAFFARIYRVNDAGKRIAALLDLVELGKRGKDRVGAYSRGMRQRLSLARAMVHNPEVLVLDEPTAGVDPSGQIEVRKILLDVAHRENKTIFLSSHNLDEVQRICNRIALIDRGEIKLYGGLENLRREMGGGEVVVETAGEIPGPILAELSKLTSLGFKEISGKNLIFSSQKNIEVSDIVSAVVGKGIKIEKVMRREASLEEMYAAILKEVEPV